MKYRYTRGEKLFNIINIILMTLMICVMIYPFIHSLALSLSKEPAIISGRVGIIPEGFNIRAYKEVLSDKRYITALMNTIYFTVLATAATILMTMMFAYPLSRKVFGAKKFIMNILIFSMMFGTGGLMPNYMFLTQTLNLKDNYGSIIFPAAISIYFTIVFKNFFQQIPESLVEAATIDGASQFKILFKIILPLCLPVIAALSLFRAVEAWNTYYNAIIYLDADNHRLLQVHLQQVLANYIQPTSPGIDNRVTDGSNRVAAEAIKSATLMLTVLPIVCVYPFVQKYFVTGMLTGAVKG